MKKGLALMIGALFLIASINLVCAEIVKITVETTEGDGEDLKIEVEDYISISGKSVQVQTKSGGSDIEGKTQIKSEGISAISDLEVTQEENSAGKIKLKAKLSNGETMEIKIMPDEAYKKAKDSSGLDSECNEDNECEVELKESGEGEGIKLVYKVQAQKQVKLLWLIKKKMKVQTEVNANSGEILSTNKPWWGFLAT